MVDRKGASWGVEGREGRQERSQLGREGRSGGQERSQLGSGGQGGSTGKEPVGEWRVGRIDKEGLWEVLASSAAGLQHTISTESRIFVISELVV